MPDIQQPPTLRTAEPAVNLAELPDIPPMGVRTVAVEAESVGKQKKVAHIRQFEILCDEPEWLGGEDQYPQPLNYLVAGVAF